LPRPKKALQHGGVAKPFLALQNLRAMGQRKKTKRERERVKR
jgi:hypothetical protein